ncbi:hypothetical protein M413DRAFT_30196 [Hebeloma cylindrosporum]|uniref:Uncharacterized protein n=1 Tax=Hebeloma cylindrosporum TaxID=76867 RepID=A0A0C3C427_HEBCY|nr:hypothetical protein M413DRAFT_30196 [Hebeloma cylindrosporum h7]
MPSLSLIAVDLDEVGLSRFVNALQSPSLERIDAAQRDRMECSSFKPALPVLQRSGLFSICGTGLCLSWLHEGRYNPTPYFGVRETAGGIVKCYSKMISSFQYALRPRNTFRHHISTSGKRCRRVRPTPSVPTPDFDFRVLLRLS